MSIWNPRTWGNKQFAPVETKSSSKVLGLSESLGNFLMFGTPGSAATPTSAMNLYNSSSAVSIPINYIAEAFASINPVLKDGTEIISDHPVLQLLQTPSPFYTQDLFLENLAKNYLITGEAELIAIGNINRPPLELQPINPKNVTINEGSSGLAVSMVVSGETLMGSYNLMKRGRSVRYVANNLTELKQIRNYSTKNNSLLRGQSPLVSASAEARQHIEGNNHNVNLLTNGGRVSLVFHFKEDLQRDDFDETKRRVMEQYAGTNNAGKIGVTAGESLEIKDIGINNRDMDFANLQKMAQTAVALQYKFPLPLLSTDASTFNNYKESKSALYDDAVLPLADRIFGGLSDFLLPRFGLDPSKVRITYDLDQVTALASRRNEELKLRRDLNLETTNEMRALLGREPVDGGDFVLAPATMVPVGTDLFTDDNNSDASLNRDTDQ
jgi:HK97 family phage portal protein